MQDIQVRSLGREDSPGGGNGNPFQYSHLGNPMDRGAWWATVHGVVKSWTRLSMHQQAANNKQEGLEGCSFRPLSSVQPLSHVWLFATPGLQHARLPYPSPSPGICSNSCPSSWWCHPTISSHHPFLQPNPYHSSPSALDDLNICFTPLCKLSTLEIFLS